MTYSDFKNSYRVTLKHYPATSALFEVKNVGECKITTENKDGRHWKASEVKTEEMSFEYYFNTLEAIPFFRNLGAYERVTNAYTKHGYIPVRLVSISPDGNTRVTREFIF